MHRINKMLICPKDYKEYIELMELKWLIEVTFTKELLEYVKEND